MSTIVDESRPTMCEFLAKQGGLEYLAVPIAAQTTLIAGHLVALVISVLILRWRQQWVDAVSSPKATTPVSPHRLFTIFSCVSFFNVIVMFAYALFLTIAVKTSYGYGYAVYSVFGAAFVGFLYVRMQNIDIHRPVVGAKLAAF
ncbi:hypothetical protein BJ742DRAFT_829373 [Cladochytrium replicatum]|nr:hypothetical protein BJ742DRAFT_829373 [Cladochytrium replicatum]